MIRRENKYFIFDKPREINLKYFVKHIYILISNLYYTLLFLLVRIENTSKKYNVSICAIFKNESLYLKEWIEFHRIIGIDHFYMYNNNSDDDFQSILDPYIEAGIVTLSDWPYNQGQIKAYTDCVNRFSDETNWLGFIDLDEFIVPIRDNSITEFLSRFNNRPSVKINWNVFGTSGFINRKSDGLVTEDFTICWGKIDEIGKCFLNTKFALNPNNRHNKLFHHSLWASWKNFTLPPVNCFGHICRNEFEIANSIDFPIVINHYFTKSYQEYYDKMCKGDVYFANNPHNLDYFYRHESLCAKCDFHVYKYLIKLKKSLE